MNETDRKPGNIFTERAAVEKRTSQIGVSAPELGGNSFSKQMQAIEYFFLAGSNDKLFPDLPTFEINDLVPVDVS